MADVERWEERLRARARLRRAAEGAPWLLGVLLGDHAVVVTVSPGAAADARAFVEALALGVRVELREATETAA